MDTAGEGEGGTNSENSTQTYTLPYVKQIASGNVLCDTGSSTQCCDNLEGWDAVADGRWVQKGGDIFLPVGDSC